MLTKEDLDKIQKLIRDSLFTFWEEVIEPVMVTKDELQEVKDDVSNVKVKVNSIEEDVNKVKTKVDSIEEDVNEVKAKVDSIDRKLTAEVGYHDRMEKRVKKIETKVGIE